MLSYGLVDKVLEKLPASAIAPKAKSDE